MENENVITTEEYSENEIVIESLYDFLMHISELRKNVKEMQGQETDSQTFFFRGQANLGWDVIPGVFRNNYLVTEAELINAAYLRNPIEFRKLDTDFEKLAKLQHYGLPTRLLDVTSNPLVALYFACQKNEEFNDEENVIKETDGLVLFKRAYSKGCNDLEVSVLSHLANITLDGDITLNKLLEELKDKRIYTEKMAKECESNDYKSLITILQNNYFVLSNLNNERLIRQSGLFLFVGKYNIIFNDIDIGKSVIQTAKSSARADFEKDVFRIPSEKKSDILEELDFYNINEGALFPELEHQMSYIKQFQSGRLSLDVGTFSKLEIKDSDEIKSETASVDLTDEQIIKIIEDVLKEIVDPSMFYECKSAIATNLAVDWYQREIILSKIRVALTDVMCKKGVAKADAKSYATKIVDEILNAINSITQ